MTSIMFICHGNICRSPMAEFIFRDMVIKSGRMEDFYIASCATSTEEIGNRIYPPAKAELQRHGIKSSDRSAVQLRKSDYDRYDMFLCMDSRNVFNALRILGGDPKSKVRRLLPDRDVSDPWFTDRFDVAYSDIYDGCRMLLESL